MGKVLKRVFVVLVHTNSAVPTLVYGDQNPHEERLKRQAASLSQLLVQFRVSQSDLSTDILIEDQTEYLK